MENYVNVNQLKEILRAIDDKFLKIETYIGHIKFLIFILIGVVLFAFVKRWIDY